MRSSMKSLPKTKASAFYGVGVTLLLLSALLGLLLGSTTLSIPQALSSIASGDLGSPAARILLYVRLPRVLATLVCGAALAVSGAVIQGVLANRLASPGIVGVNAGAGLAVTLCSAFGIVGGWKLSLFSFLGAFLTVMLVGLGARRWNTSRGTVILIGVALNALLGAISDTVVTFCPEVSIMSNDFKIGDFSTVTYSKILPAAIAVLLSLLVLQTLWRELDVLTLGDESARGLGMNVGAARVIFLLLSALLAGAAVSVCGLLSFVGLLVPHAIRRLSTSQNKHLIPLCALFGAGFVTLCDTLARVIFAPYELPVGILMAFLGAPFFIFLLLRGKGGERYA